MNNFNSLKDNLKLQLKMLYLENFHLFDNLTLDFNHTKYCIIINDNNSSRTNSRMISEALTFMFSSEYTEEKARNLLIHNKTNGLVRAVFILNEPLRQLEAIRTLENSTKISIIEDNIVQEFNFNYFIAKYINPYWGFDYNSFNDSNNLLDNFYNNFWKCNKYYENAISRSTTSHPAPYKTSNDIKIKIAKAKKFQDIALKLQETIMRRKNPENITTFKKISLAINETFQKLTYGYYRVKFLIPKSLTISDTDIIKVDARLSLEHWSDKLKTVVISKNDNYTHWTKANRHIKFLLKLSAQIVLSLFYKQNVIFIRNFLELQDSQNEELFNEFMVRNYLENKPELENPNISQWKFHNFVQTIIDVCQENKLLAIINLKNIVPLKNANIIFGDISKNGKFIYYVSEEITNIKLNFRNECLITDITFRDDKIQLLSHQQAQAAVEESKRHESIIDQTPSVAPIVEEDEEIHDNGVDEKDIELVISQAHTSRAKAIRALKNNSNDILNAIMELTML